MPKALLAASFLSGTALSADVDVSGRYEDVAGDPITIAQSGSTLTVTPNTRDMPQQARQYLGDIKLTGQIADRGNRAFSINAKYEKVIEPMPSMKLKMKITFDATGRQVDEGLVMKTCNWEAHMVVFADGEIAGSENTSEKCVGLWKKTN